MRKIILMTALVGCAAKPAARTAADEAAVADVMEHHRHHHHGGALMFIAMSLDTLGLSPEERVRVEKIQADLLAKMQPAGAAQRELVAALAEGVASSSLDRGKIDEAVGRLEAATAGVHDAAVEELNQLHAALTPAERTALVQKVEAHWELWKRANHGERAHLPSIGKQIGLTPEQMEKVRKELEPVHAAAPVPERPVGDHLQQFSAAFVADNFDAKTLSHANEANRHMARWGAVRLARFCEAANPVLTPEQRAKLGELLREHQSHDEARAKE
jgi:Spy/CpxP family protein refolding chaperone